MSVSSTKADKRLLSSRPHSVAATGAGLLLAVACAQASSSGGDALGCGAVGCTDGAIVRLDTTSGTWAAGSYRIDLTIDGTASMCAFTTSGADLLTKQVTCSPTLRASFICRAFGFDAGCNSVPPQFALELSIEGTPAQVALSASRDGSAIATATIAPKYMIVQPNGPNCAPTCHSAEWDLSVN